MFNDLGDKLANAGFVVCKDKPEDNTVSKSVADSKSSVTIESVYSELKNDEFTEMNWPRIRWFKENNGDLTKFSQLKWMRDQGDGSHMVIVEGNQARLVGLDRWLDNNNKFHVKISDVYFLFFGIFWNWVKAVHMPKCRINFRVKDKDLNCSRITFNNRGGDLDYNDKIMSDRDYNEVKEIRKCSEDFYELEDFDTWCFGTNSVPNEYDR